MNLELKQVVIGLDNRKLFEPVCLTVSAGEVFSLMGPSGCGKSTLLSFVAGTLGEQFDASGDVLLNNQSLRAEPVENRRVGILFQDPLLFPHMTVVENLMFAASAGSLAEKRQQTLTSLADIGLEHCADFYPRQLSGGQAARVSLMRTLAAKPRALLLDEPFSKLDRETREHFRTLVFTTVARRNIPAILVTHDEDDVADRNRVLRLNN
ncbi:ATP-binding cassette domain-containing protein [Endozoicomonas gorgoniicola]|uniref:ATP-binding cassette domain-containing protein n=1 Tax=Endozoicomonas gorgoniicola TaxID=1234144 RepID=A0ABT3N415_9GAMM|nr:ATP-binding cassette domain-containing protein [Endozoicomonas gorgoniicola]MCW7555944.1 ATP-binding cassette domain-containing protein [Endozoicomonas gorgoniicola]